jgi:MFS family permease
MSSATSSDESDEPDEPRLFSRDFLLVLVLQLAFGFAFSIFFLLPKYVVTELGGGPSQVGYVGAIAVVMAVLASPLAGRLLDRGPRRPLILAGTAFSTLASFAFLGVSELGPYLYAVRALQGLSATLFFVATGTLVADLAPPARLGQALGLWGSASLIMNAAATLVAERIAHAYGWPSVFATAGVVNFVGLLLALSLRERARKVEPAAMLATAGAIIRERLPALWAGVAGGAAFGVMFTFAPPFALSLGEIHVSPLFTGYTVSALSIRLLFGNLADRIGRARVAAAALAFYTLVVASTAALATGWLFVLGLGFGLAHGAYYPSVNALALENASHRQRGTISGYFNAAFNGGVLLVTFCFGHVAQAYGYPSIFLLVALITATGCPLLYNQMRRKSWLAQPHLRAARGASPAE